MTRLLLLLILVAIVAGGIRLFAPRYVAHVLYWPEPLHPDRTSPAAWGFMEAEEVRFLAADGVSLHGWFFPAEGARRGAAIWFHGNAGNLTSRGDVAAAIARRGLDVLLFDCRGYGASEGVVTEAGLYADAAGAWHWLREEKGAEADRTVLFGNSLGSAVAVALAQEMARGSSPVAGLVAIGPLSSTVRVARADYPFIPGFLLDWQRNRFDAETRIAGIEAPSLFVRGARDEVLPRVSSRALYDAARRPKRWVEVPGAGHNDIVARPDTWAAIDRFLDEVLAPDGKVRRTGS